MNIEIYDSFQDEFKKLLMVKNIYTDVCSEEIVGLIKFSKQAEDAIGAFSPKDLKKDPLYQRLILKLLLELKMIDRDIKIELIYGAAFEPYTLLINDKYIVYDENTWSVKNISNYYSKRYNCKNLDQLIKKYILLEEYEGEFSKYKDYQNKKNRCKKENIEEPMSNQEIESFLKSVK